MTFKESWKERSENVRKIWTAGNLYGIEKPIGACLFVLNTLTLTELIRLFIWNWEDKFPDFHDLYVVIVTVFLGFLLARSPPGSSGIATYFLASIIVYLLNVVLLSKVFGGSRERSLILLAFNIAQVVLIFAIFYRLKVPSLRALDALVDSLLVFGTVSLPNEVEARSIAGFQVAIDFMLLAVFLAHFVGGFGRGDALEERPSPEKR